MADDGWKARLMDKIPWLLGFALVLLSAKQLLDIGIIDILTNDAVKVIKAFRCK